MLGRYSTAREHLRKAEALAEAITLQTEEVMGLRADILHDTAMNHYYSGGDAEQTIDYLDTALSIIDHTAYRTRRGVCLMGIGNVRFSQANYEDALTYYESALDMLDDIDSYANVSAVLSNMGSCLIQLSRYEEAERHLMRSLDLRSRMGSYAEIAASYYNLFVLYWERGERTKAYDTLLISRDYAQRLRPCEGIQMRVLEALEKEARGRGDMASADSYLAERIGLQEVVS
jgi:tetratricopeptide (TPR) repeat protein